ncbi:MAG: class I SAM-dependent methyltransferase, partial [Coriobacteriales bacterium]|nr:class I SAM-dependent methyltransferase [Coriobacteriales bacterium]
MISGVATGGEGARSFEYGQQQLRDYLQWDIGTWKHALRYWDTVLAKRPQTDGPLKALDLGARDGGLSLYLAQKGFEVVCSDIEGPTERAHELHAHYGLTERITYQAVDATAIPFEDDCFDVIIFKSILGGIGTFLNYAAIETAVSEMRRVL